MLVRPSLQYPAYYDTFQKRASREHDIVVLAVNPALKAYGQMITDTIEAASGKKGQDFLKEFFAEQQGQGAKPRRFHYRKPKVFQVSLGGENYVEPCIMDFNDKGYLYAIICNEANKRHGSVTLRILHSDQGKLCCHNIIRSVQFLWNFVLREIYSSVIPKMFVFLLSYNNFVRIHIMILEIYNEKIRLVSVLFYLNHLSGGRFAFRCSSCL